MASVIEAQVADVPAASGSPTTQARRKQMFLRLDTGEIDRLRRFGEERGYRSGEYLAQVGDLGLGLFVILQGSVAISQRLTDGRSLPIVTHETGGFMGELAQLSGRPSLVDALATSDVEALLRGIFAVGDVRSESVKRVAAAAGDGAQVVASIHAFLAHEDNANG